jgi:tetratricopeptide (TPR) repeat protein
LPPTKLTFRQLLLSMLALRYGRRQKQIGSRAGMPEKRVSHHLRRERLREIKDDVYEQLLEALKPYPPAAVPIVTACLEALDALDQGGDLTAEERAEIEEEILVAARRLREDFAEAMRFSRAAPTEGYPGPGDLVPARRQAEVLFGRLEALPEAMRSVVVSVCEQYQTWALTERVCAASVEAASRDLEVSAAWARLAQEIAERVRGPEGFRTRLQGYAAAHGPNVLRVVGELKAAEPAFEAAKRLWLSGSDPYGVLDPGRLLDLEASLRRAQRRTEEALALLDEAAAVSHCPERVLINKGFTLEVMGEYERAVETLLQALPLAERAGDPRLLYMARFNLAVTYTHVGRYAEAAGLLQQVQDLASERGDRNEVSRVTWLEGRIAAGQGRTREARRLLAKARQEFHQRQMFYDVSLALLEEAVLLLEEGRAAEVKGLARELAEVFESQGVHREALAALQVFQEAVAQETATAELARRILGFLFRARHDQGLRFES